MREDGLLTIGKVVGVHGVRGVIKIISHAASDAVFTSGGALLIHPPDNAMRPCDIEWVRPRKRLILASVKGIRDRNQAEALVGADIFIRRADLPACEEDAYYWVDLIGLTVATTEDAYLGELTAILETGGNDVYVVKNGTRERLIPAIKSVVVDVNLDEKRMTVDLPEGLP